jgi:UDP-N-acetylmuramate-alanine ligase
LADLPDLSHFSGVKRRLQLRHDSKRLRLLEDFGHHPTAIHQTLLALKAAYPGEQLLAIIHMGSNSMCSGVHDQALERVLAVANSVCILSDDANVRQRVGTWAQDIAIAGGGTDLVQWCFNGLQQNATVVIFSNKGAEAYIEAIIAADQSA